MMGIGKWVVAGGLMMLTAMSAGGPALAEGFDTSGIKADAALAARLPDKIKAAGTLIVGSDTTYAPWEYLSETDGQTPEGIDVDIAKAIGARLGVKVDYQTATFDAIIPAVGSRYDVGISAFSITNERMKVVNFVNYARSGSLWVVKAGNPSRFDVNDVCGKTIAIQTGTYYEGLITKANAACASGGKPAITVIPFSRQVEALTRVAAGGADATYSGSATMGLAVKQSNGMLEAAGEVHDYGPMGIAIVKSDEALTKLVAEAIDSLIADGTYAAIFDGWGAPTDIVDKAAINPQVAN
ncbi:MAG: ABC transporter substrate-binding protein [Rhizobium sp.]|nr:ABC transporter substrate-binding protein [Rhizobium sp.]